MQTTARDGVPRFMALLRCRVRTFSDIIGMQYKIVKTSFAIKTTRRHMVVVPKMATQCQQWPSSANNANNGQAWRACTHGAPGLASKAEPAQLV